MSGLVRGLTRLCLAAPQLLNVWAYPTAVGNFEDYIVCCVKENPEPTIFNICCQGVRPELELETKQLHFDRLLLHRSVLTWVVKGQQGISFQDSLLGFPSGISFQG